MYIERRIRMLLSRGNSCKYSIGEVSVGIPIQMVPSAAVEELSACLSATQQNGAHVSRKNGSKRFDLSPLSVSSVREMDLLLCQPDLHGLPPLPS